MTTTKEIVFDPSLKALEPGLSEDSEGAESVSGSSSWNSRESSPGYESADDGVPTGSLSPEKRRYFPPTRAPPV
jgi:hypothetical protein